MKIYFKQGDHLFYEIETGKVTAVNTEKKSIKNLVCVPSIYADKLQVITEEDFKKARKQTGL